ncbi:transposase domain-containing protein [Sphingomonas sp. AR_OL41]|uniref:transposase domain-containing protein n=1 Tax=Sphingomonas sp. AR_OL41 TaxID=3042729 RepID=UPI00248134D3|nr:transposase domain-containing protein [Sphingomonas sp. AR_OL41]MDH7971753.1 transposase domain-containing protein [Sphingomonas sp. AR_OL41]
MKPAGGKTWFTAAELAELSLPGLPKAKRKINERAQVEGWAFRTDAAGLPLCRPRQGRGGGLEYHMDILPAAARASLASRGVSIVADVRPVPESGASSRWRWFEGLNDDAKAKAKHRAGVVASVDAYVRAGLTRSAAVATVSARASVSPATLWSWLAMIDGVAPADRLPFLAPQHKGGGTESDVDATVWQYLLSDYLRPEKPTWSSCYRRATEMATSIGVTLPHQKTLQRKLEREVDGRLIIAQREGADALRRAMPPQQRSVMDLHALEAVNIDGHKFDVFVRWPDGRVGRPLMVAIQDLYSRKMLAWRIDESESALATRMVFGDLFRNWGIPKKCLLDNGRAFASKMITGGAKTRFRFKIKDEEPTGVLTALGVEIHFALPYRGQSKPIERAFRDMCDAIAKHPAFAGAYTGNSPDAKPENYGSKAIPIEDFRRMVDACLAEHNRREGRRTETAQGRSFDATFAESYAVAPIGKATPEQLRLTLLTAEDRPVDRQTSVITLEGNRYWTPELSAYAGKRVVVRFDPDNLHGEVHVYTREGRFIATAPVIAAVGFFDKAAAGARRKLEGGARKLARDLAAQHELLKASDIAAMLPAYEDEAPAPQPTVVRPVRHRGQAVALRQERVEQAANQAGILDRMAAGITRLHAVK